MALLTVFTVAFFSFVLGMVAADIQYSTIFKSLSKLMSKHQVAR